MASLLHEFVLQSAQRTPDAPALAYQDTTLSYAHLTEQSSQFAQGLLAAGVKRAERVGVYLDKRPETVVACFGASAAGAVFVPVNPLLKPEQVAYILRDCNVRVLVTSSERLQLLTPILSTCPDLRGVVLTPSSNPPPSVAGVQLFTWQAFTQMITPVAAHRAIDQDMAAILYTSGSTGKPKGVVLSHRNLVTGAASVAQYLENRATDRLLAVLPFSFDYGFSQLTTAFLTGACTVLFNYLLPRDVLSALERYRITGLAAVPPLWIQLAQLTWPSSLTEHLRYITNSGGAMPTATLQALRQHLPKTRVFLMYGLTEAFRSTYLPPEELDRRPDSIGKAIPNAEVLVVRPDGSPCAPDEVGELVHRGALVSLGYWNDPVKTAERFKPVPQAPGELTLPELAVWSGDSVRQDAQGFLYFIGRQDEMIKTSGYRVSPSEIEEVLYASGHIDEAVALGVPHPVLGQVIAVVATAAAGTTLNPELLLAECKRRLPAYMQPAHIQVRDSLPRNPNGKIDRQALHKELENIAQETA